MRKIMLLSSAVLLTMSFSSFSTPVSLEYKGFYDRLKVVNKGNYQLVDIAFSVPMSADCQILSGSISTENTRYPLTYTEDQRLLLPFNDELKSNRGLVNLNVAGDASLCNIAMQVRAKQALASYSGEVLQQTATEMNALLDSIQGFPMRYFREPIAGLNFQFSPDTKVTVDIDGNKRTIGEQWQLSQHELDNIRQLSFSQAPRYISPWVK